MSRTLPFDPSSLQIGAALRRALPWFLEQGVLRYDPTLQAGLNDMVLFEVVDLPDRGQGDPITGEFERLDPVEGAIRIRKVPYQTGLGLGVAGNRYAPPRLIGGLRNPLGREANGILTGGSRAVCLGLGVIGFVNHRHPRFQSPEVRVLGGLTDREGRPLDLRRFKEELPAPEPVALPDTPLVVVAGHASDSGKSTCVRALVRELTGQGLRVSLEKKTGTASHREIHGPFTPADVDASGRPWESEMICRPEAHLGRDFVDGPGVVSDVSQEPGRFVRESLAYTRGLLSFLRPDVHVVELSDNLCHRTNLMLLGSEDVHSHVACLVYCPIPSAEGAIMAMDYIREDLGYSAIPLILSGPLANEERHAMAREEIRERCGATILPSARWQGERWMAQGEGLGPVVLEAMDRHAARRGR